MNNDYDIVIIQYTEKQLEELKKMVEELLGKRGDEGSRGGRGGRGRGSKI